MTISGEPSNPWHSLAASPLNKPAGIGMMPVSRYGRTISNVHHHSDLYKISFSTSAHQSAQKIKIWESVQILSVLEGNKIDNQVPLLPPVDLFLHFFGRKSAWDYLGIFEIKNNIVFRVFVCHLTLFPEELMKMKWRGFRE